jgi:ubiquinone/menaquinone biosynthesis C-methylase UbiE
MLEKARAKAGGLNVKYDIGDAENPPYAENTYDAVYCRHLLWTLPNPEKALQGWKRVLKDGGRVLVVDGVWKDSALNAKARRFVSNVAKLAVERTNPWKEYYSKELRSALPNIGGTPLDKAKGYMEMAGLRNVGHMDLKYVLEVERKSMPLRDRICHDFEYYLVYGDK